MTKLTMSSTIRPPTMTMANGRCESEPISCERAAGKSPSVATSMVIMMGRRRSSAPSLAACRGSMPRVHAAGAELVDVLDHDDADFDGNTGQREEAEAGGHGEMRAGGEQREHAAEGRERDYGEDEANPFPGVEHRVQDESHEQQRNRHDDRQS